MHGYCSPNELQLIIELEVVMSKTSFVRARVEPELKADAEHVLSEMGITPTQAITMLYKRVARDHEWPLELKIPNNKTVRTIAKK
jgi:DNA-damage-inducible protein J